MIPEYMDIDVKIQKKVQFSDKIEINYTYSKEQYDRSIINSTFVMRYRKKINDHQWKLILMELNHYKLYEMELHPSNLTRRRK